MSRYRVEWWPGILPWRVLNVHDTEVCRCETWGKAMRIARVLAWAERCRQYGRRVWNPVTGDHVEVPVG